jgi:uncharacterized damage-inducible protein DinB
MSDANLLEALLDSWDRNNKIQLGLLRDLPAGGLEAKAIGSEASVGQTLSHICYIRLVHVFEDAPEHSTFVPQEEWAKPQDRDHLAALLAESAATVRTAFKSRLLEGRQMDLHYDHPVLLIQNLLWHEAYHYGQIKLALKQSGIPITDDQDAGQLPWIVWMDKTPQP